MKILSYLLLILSLTACNDPQEVELSSIDSVIATAKSNVVTEVVNKFYQSIADRDCQQAISLRPKYTSERCEALSNINLNTVREEYSDGLSAVIYLSVDFAKGESQQNFNGYLWLKNLSGKWLIQEDFSSVENTSYDEFLKRYIPLAESKTVTPTKLMDDVLDDNSHPATLSRLRKDYSHYSNSKIVLVDVSQQQLSFYDAGDKLIAQYPISTATKGAGNQAGSDQTPLGSHVISNRIGSNADYGSIFIGRVNTGKIAQIIDKPVDSPSDLVTSRILWLDGLEAGKNKGGNVDSHKRYIYIHGTQEEGLIGKPASHGCIRMKNNDVITLFDQTAENTLVYIAK